MAEGRDCINIRRMPGGDVTGGGQAGRFVFSGGAFGSEGQTLKLAVLRFT